MSTENIAVVYSMGGYDQRGTVPSSAVVYVAREHGTMPVPFESIITTGEVLTAAEWECRCEDGDAHVGAYVRHGNRAIPVRLAGGAS